MIYLTNFRIFTLLLLAGLLLIGCDQSAKIEADFSSSDSLVVELTATDSTTPLQLLIDNHQVDYRSSMMGAFVTAIDSTENSSAGYWVYSVNDTTPEVACDRMSLISGDRLKWHFKRVSSESDSDSSSGE